MEFQSEQEMKKVACNEFPKLFDNHDDTKLLTEYHYGAGRTDIVVAGTSEPYLDRRISELGIELPIHSRDYLRPFLILRRIGKRTYDFFLEFCEGISGIEEGLDWLMSKGFVVREGNKIRTVPNLRRHVTTSYAIELKVENWKRGLRQASRAKAYSEYQYLAMDRNYIHRAQENIEEFRKFNIGLLSLTSNGDCRVILQPDREAPSIPISKWSLNEAVFSRQKD